MFKQLFFSCSQTHSRVLHCYIQSRIRTSEVCLGWQGILLKVHLGCQIIQAKRSGSPLMSVPPSSPATNCDHRWMEGYWVMLGKEKTWPERTFELVKSLWKPLSLSKAWARVFHEPHIVGCWSFSQGCVMTGGMQVSPTSDTTRSS